jgi:hypothetical protein
MNLVIASANMPQAKETIAMLASLGALLFAILLLVSPLIIVIRLGKILRYLERQTRLLEWMADRSTGSEAQGPPAD